MHKPTTKHADRARFALVAALYKQQIAELIKARRSELGLTQKQLADRAHVAEPQTVSRWERAENLPTDLEPVAQALEYGSVNEMLQSLQPLHEKERRRMVPHGPTQLDRIEGLLLEIVERLDEHGLTLPSPMQVAEEAADRPDERPEPDDQDLDRTDRKADES